MALFGEKYGETVRVVCMEDFSKEFCGGTHVSNTGAITAFKIISESGIAAGVRRIEALTGRGLMHYYSELENRLNEAAKAAKTNPAKLCDKIVSMQEEIKALTAENENLKKTIANQSMGDVMKGLTEINGVKFLPVSSKDVDMNALRDLGDDLKAKIGEGIVLIASEAGDKVNLLATATEEAMKKGVHAGNLIKSIAAHVGGGGGGRPNMAQAGGKNPAGIPDALKAAAEVLKEQIKL